MATGKVDFFGSVAAVPNGRNVAVDAFTTSLSLFLGNLQQLIPEVGYRKSGTGTGSEEMLVGFRDTTAVATQCGYGTQIHRVKCAHELTHRFVRNVQTNRVSFLIYDLQCQVAYSPTFPESTSTECFSVLSFVESASRMMESKISNRLVNRAFPIASFNDEQSCPKK